MNQQQHSITTTLHEDSGMPGYESDQFCTFVEIKYPELFNPHEKLSAEHTSAKLESFISDAVQTELFTSYHRTTEIIGEFPDDVLETLPQTLQNYVEKHPADIPAINVIIRVLCKVGNTQTLINTILFTHHTYEQLVIEELIDHHNPKVSIYLTSLPALPSPFLVQLWERALAGDMSANESELLKYNIVSHPNCPKNILTTVAIFNPQHGW